jgi:hypothetical protein
MRLPSIGDVQDDYIPEIVVSLGYFQKRPQYLTKKAGKAPPFNSLFSRKESNPALSLFPLRPLLYRKAIHPIIYIL